MAWKITETLLALHIIHVNACSLPSTFSSLTSLAAWHSRVLLFMTARVRASVNIQHVTQTDKMFQIQ